MTIAYVLQRLRQQRRPLLFLLLAVSLATSFAGLGPYYLRYTSEVLLDQSLADLTPFDATLTFMSPVPFDDTADTLLDENVVPYVESQFRFARSIYADSPIQPICIPGEPINGEPSLDHCLQMFGFDETFDGKYTLVEGRIPSAEIRTEESLDGIAVIVYIEGMVSTEVAEVANLRVGRSFTTTRTVTQGDKQIVNQILIVGTFEPVNRDDFFWLSNGMMDAGGYVNLPGLGVDRFDFGVAMNLDGFENSYGALGAKAQYVNFMTVDPTTVDSVRAANIYDSIDDSISQLQRELGEPIQVSSGILTMFRQHRQRIADAEAAVIMLSGMLLALILYNFVSTASMIFYTQANEWTMLRARGGSTKQLLPTQLLPAVLIAAIAFAITALSTKGLLIAMSYINRLVNGTSQHIDIIQRLDTPSIVLKLSAITAVMCGLIMLIPIFQTESDGIQSRRQLISRPDAKPRWASLFLDFIFISIGLIMILRLYYLSEDGTLTAFLRDFFGRENIPANEFAATSSSTTEFSDPFSLIAPIFLLTGSALLWLRVFPILMRGLSLSVDRLRKLGFPLAVWNVERNSGHYRQFALLLVGTLAIGTASVSLLRTQQQGAWQLALTKTGGHAKLAFDSTDNDPALWRDDNNVSAYSELIHEVATEQGISSNVQLHIVGVDPATFSNILSENIPALNQLQEMPQTGLILPDATQALSVDVWSEAMTNERIGEPHVALRAYLYDANGVHFEVDLNQPTDAAQMPSPTPAAEWLAFTGQLPTAATSPLHLYRVSMESRHADRSQFSHTVFLNNWAALNDNGTVTPLNLSPEQGLTPALSQRPFVGNWVANLDPHREKIDGITSAWVDGNTIGVTGDNQPLLRVDYEIIAYNETTAPHPSLAINTTPIEPVTAILSSHAAFEFRGQDGQENHTNDPLGIGDERRLTFNLGLSGNLALRIHVVDVLDDHSVLAGAIDQDFIILPINTTRLLFNQQFQNERADRRRFTDVNEVWVNFPDRFPSESFETAVIRSNRITESVFAWDRYNTILNQPIPNTVAGLFFAGFWVSLILSLLNFMLYISVTAKQRIVSFGVLRSLGWNINNIWRLMFMEQTVLFIPTVIIGTLLGIGLAYILLPFLALPGSFSLQLPLAQITVMIVVLSTSFIILLSVITLWLRQVSVAHMIRLSED
jgi:hypothetical protein